MGQMSDEGKIEGKRKPDFICEWQTERKELFMPLITATGLLEDVFGLALSIVGLVLIGDDPWGRELFAAAALLFCLGMRINRDFAVALYDGNYAKSVKFVWAGRVLDVIKWAVLILGLWWLV